MRHDWVAMVSLDFYYLPMRHTVGIDFALGSVYVYRLPCGPRRGVLPWRYEEKVFVQVSSTLQSYYCISSSMFAQF
jgi:hypothetical protein